MTRIELQTIFRLSAILSFRMFGVFAALPILAIYASHLKHSTPLLVGMSLGIYGLTQAIFQIPLGSWSDKIGRKKVIALGLVIFTIGSLIAATSTSIYTLVLGRALQGAGAIGSTTTAFLADLTHETHRTRAMAMIGMTIGLSFSLALIIGPALVPHTGVHGIFYLAAIMGIAGLFILRKLPAISVHRSAVNFTRSHALQIILRTPNLVSLFISIFILHAIFTATFVVLPISLKAHNGLNDAQQWMLYVPTLVIALTLSILMIIVAEKKQLHKKFFLAAIIIIGIGETLLWLAPSNLILAGCGLTLFFTGFSTLEAFIPAKASKIAPKQHRGMAMGFNSSCQFLGIFFGGIMGGWLYGQHAFSTVYIFCILLTFLWIIKDYRDKVTDVNNSLPPTTV